MTAPESRRGNEYFRETERIAAAARIRELEDALAETARDRDEGWRQHNLEVIRRIESLEASARAAGSATAALREIDRILNLAYGNFLLDAHTVARAALAVLGHATPAAADEERAEG